MWRFGICVHGIISTTVKCVTHPWLPMCMVDPRTHLSYHWKLVPFDPNLPITPTPWPLPTTVSSLPIWINFLKFHLQVRAVLYLVYFLQVHPCCCKWQDFFLWLHSIRVCIYTSLSLLICLWTLTLLLNLAYCKKMVQ